MECITTKEELQKYFCIPKAMNDLQYHPYHSFKNDRETFCGLSFYHHWRLEDKSKFLKINEEGWKYKGSENRCKNCKKIRSLLYHSLCN